MSSEQVELSLSKSEALVLFDFIERYSSSGKLEIIDKSDEVALEALCCALEKALPEPFSENYLDVLQASRNQLLG